MSFSELQLGEFIRIKHGFAFRGDFFREEGKYVILTPGHFFEAGGFRDRPDKDRFYVGDFPESFILPKRSLIIAMTEQGAGLLGSSALVPADDRYLHNQRIGLVRITEPDQLDDEYLYRLFNTRTVRAQINASASGTKVRHTAPERVYRVKVSIPPIDVQRKIASAIAQYDDLIENNRRRIALLEQAARLLYEEWFVRFRFPGHEHAKFINGLPEGWEQRKFGSILTLQRGFDLPSASRIDGDVPVYGSTGVLDHHNVSKVTVPTVITGRSGSLGQVCYADQPCWPLNTCLWVKEFKGVSPYFAYHLLKAMDLSRMNGGASVPTLDRKAVHRVDVVLPTSAVLSLFDEYVSKIFSGQKILNQQNEKLTQTRDLLLPRLMSGEVEV